MNESSTTLTITEAAVRSGVSKATIRRYLKNLKVSGRDQSIMIGKRGSRHCNLIDTKFFDTDFAPSRRRHANAKSQQKSTYVPSPETRRKLRKIDLL